MTTIKYYYYIDKYIVLVLKPLKLQKIKYNYNILIGIYFCHVRNKIHFWFLLIIYSMISV